MLERTKQLMRVRVSTIGLRRHNAAKKAAASTSSLDVAAAPSGRTNDAVYLISTTSNGNGKHTVETTFLVSQFSMMRKC